MSQTQEGPKPYGTPTDDEIEAWGTVSDEDLRAWGMTPVDEADAAPVREERVLSAAAPGSRAAEAQLAHDAPPPHAASVAEEAATDVPPEAVAAAEAPAGEDSPAAPDESATVAAPLPVDAPAEGSAKETATLADASGGSAPASLAPSDGAGTEPGHGPTGARMDFCAELPDTEHQLEHEPVPVEPAPLGGHGDVPLAGRARTADGDEPAAGEVPAPRRTEDHPPAASAGPVPLPAGPSIENHAPIRSTGPAPLPAGPPTENHPPIRSTGPAPLPAGPSNENQPSTGFLTSALRPEPQTSGLGTATVRETDSRATASNPGRRGKPLLAAASAAGVLLIGMPLLLLGRGHEGDEQRAEHSDVPAGSVLDDTNPEAGLVVTDARTSPGTGKHRGPAAKDEKHPAAAVSPSALPRQRKTPKHAANSSPTQRVPVRVTPKTSDSGRAPSRRTGQTTTTRQSAGTHTQATTVVVRSTRTLTAGASWSATLARMAMRSDGNLVIYDERGGIRWASNTSGSGNYAVFQADGNLVVYNAAGQPLWSSGSAGHNGAELVLQNDGNVVISHNGAVLWASGTEH